MTSSEGTRERETTILKMITGDYFPREQVYGRRKQTTLCSAFDQGGKVQMRGTEVRIPDGRGITVVRGNDFTIDWINLGPLV